MTQKADGRKDSVRPPRSSLRGRRPYRCPRTRSPRPRSSFEGPSPSIGSPPASAGTAWRASRCWSSSQSSCSSTSGPPTRGGSHWREASAQRASVQALRDENHAADARASASCATRTRSSARRAGSAWSSAPSSAYVIEDLPRRSVAALQARAGASLASRRGVRDRDVPVGGGRAAAAATPPEDRRALERATSRIVEELRRRLGGPSAPRSSPTSTTRAPTGRSRSPSRPRPRTRRPGSAQVVADAAFLRYLREARDFAGGRLVTEER